jgi:hypothetical protein
MKSTCNLLAILLLAAYFDDWKIPWWAFSLPMTAALGAHALDRLATHPAKVKSNKVSLEKCSVCGIPSPELFPGVDGGLDAPACPDCLYPEGS